MRLGIDASRANHQQKTGVENYAYHVIEELKHITPNNVRVILYTDKPLQGFLALLPNNWEERVLSWPPRRLWTHIRLSIEMLLHPPDVLFIPAHVPPCIYPKHTVMTIHDVAALRFPEAYSRFERWYSLFTARYAVRHLSQIIVPSQFTKEELNSLISTNRKQNITVISHGYNVRYHANIDSHVLDKTLNKYGVQKPFILFIGRLERKKNIIRLFSAFERFFSSAQGTDFSLVLIGKPGYGYHEIEDRLKWYEQSPQHETLRRKIILPGWINEEETLIFMKEAFIFCFPSLYEGFGLPVLEAMAAGTPVITSSSSSLKEVGGDAAMFVDPKNTEELFYALQNVAENSSLREEYIKKGNTHVQLFSWAKSAEQTLQVLLA